VAKIRQRSSSAPQAFVEARAFITKQKSINTGLALYKLRTQAAQLQATLPFFLQHPAYHRLIWPAPTPRTFAEACLGGMPGVANFEQELVWTVQALLPYAPLINRFIALKSRYEDSILRGSEMEILATLARIKETCGLSLWFAESQINYLHTYRNYNAQTQYVKSIMGDRTISARFRLIISWIHFRSGHNISAAEFDRHLKRICETGNKDTFLLEQIILGSRFNITPIDAAYMLCCADMFCVVDRYLFTIRILQTMIACVASTDPLLAVIRSAIAPLITQIDDPLLRKLAIIVGHSIQINSCPPLIDILDLYTIGKYETTAQEAASFLKKKISIEVIHILLRSRAHGPRRSAINRAQCRFVS